MSDMKTPMPSIVDIEMYCQAMHRARESERSDAVFRDPFARRLAGERGAAILPTVEKGRDTSLFNVVETYLADQHVNEQVSQGADMVIALGAGLDARPYRMALPASLQWIELDRADIIAYKEEILAKESPNCLLRRIPLNLANVRARRAVFEELGRSAKKALVIGLDVLDYYSAEEVGSLAEDLARIPSMQLWLVRLLAPAMLRRGQKAWLENLGQVSDPLKFAPTEGPEFFTRYGWRVANVQTVLRTAGQLGRLHWLLRLVTPLSDRQGPRSPTWIGVCLLTNETGWKRRIREADPKRFEPGANQVDDITERSTWLRSH